MSFSSPRPADLPRGHACVGNLVLAGLALISAAAAVLIYFPSKWPFAWPYHAGPAPMAEPFPPRAPLVSCPAPVAGAAPVVDRDKPFVNGLGMEFVPVPLWEGGTRLFSRWETRVQDYAAYAKAGRGVDASWQDTGFEQGPTHPVIRVDWQDARSFCAWLTREEQRAGRLGSGWEYRLPTDLEWSAAAGLTRETDRMAEPLTWTWGPQQPPPRNAGNYRADRPDTPRARGWGWTNPNDGRTAPVGSYVPNGFGLFDLGGNAAEWVNEERPLPDEPNFRWMRGGHWNHSRPPPAAYRDVCPVGLRNTYNGFRVVIAPARPAGH